MFEVYTEKARRVIFFARFEASNLGDDKVKPTHLLLGLLREAKALFLRLSIPEEKLQAIHDACTKESAGNKRVSTSVDMPIDQEARSCSATHWRRCKPPSTGALMRDTF